MCGRYTSTSTLADLAEVFEVDEVRTEPLPPRYNVAPTLDVYAVAVRGRQDREKGPRRALGTFRWGLVPSWAKDPSVGNRMINARAETIASKPAYPVGPGPPALPHTGRRLLRVAAPDRDGRPAGSCPTPSAGATAGPWPSPDCGRCGATHPAHPPSPRRSRLRTCAIVTTAANELMAPIHDRMPVVLAPGTGAPGWTRAWPGGRRWSCCAARHQSGSRPTRSAPWSTTSATTGPSSSTRFPRRRSDPDGVAHAATVSGRPNTSSPACSGDWRFHSHR